MIPAREEKSAWGKRLMTIRIITVDREYGSGGGVIAEKLAVRLGWKLWDQRLTDEIARRLECEEKDVADVQEKRDPAYYRLFKSFMRGSFEGSLNARRLKMVDTECVREVVMQILPEIAEKGNCVIVGRGSAYYLGERPDAFHVFVYAPFADRVRRLRSTGKSEKEAMELAETVDRERADFVKQYFDIEWPDRHRFHLMVNSGLGEDVAVDTILDAVALYTKRA
jgi:cytidylate kinase